jgi:hypothetical protein
MEGQMADPWMRLTTYSLARHAKTRDIGGGIHGTRHTAIVKKKVNVSLSFFHAGHESIPLLIGTVGTALAQNEHDIHEWRTFC